MSSPRLARLVPLLAIGLPFVVSACGAPLAFTAVGYGADGASLVSTGKTATDHLISMGSKQDCAMFRIVRGKPMCKERKGDKDPYDVDYNIAEREISEDGVRYTTPMHATPDAPPVSWDAATYKTTPPAAPKVEPMTAAAPPGAAPAEPTPDPAPEQVATNDVPPPPAVQPAPVAPPKKAHSAKPKKAKAPVKKPSPNQAASRS